MTDLNRRFEGLASTVPADLFMLYLRRNAFLGSALVTGVVLLFLSTPYAGFLD
jgi:hypothetical protein